jgi:hypothetical protein
MLADLFRGAKLEILRGRVKRVKMGNRKEGREDKKFKAKKRCLGKNIIFGGKRGGMKRVFRPLHGPLMNCW